MDVFDAPGEEYDGPWILVSQGVLVFTGGVYLLLGLFTGGIYTLLPLLMVNDDPGMLIMIPFGILMLLLGLVVGGANLAAAYGLGQRTMWGYVIALIMAALYLPSGCMPFGALLAYGLLFDERTRKQFLK
ncbi:MAG: hypothetical protein R3F61_04615 [Myxococcota bacterium]